MNRHTGTENEHRDENPEWTVTDFRQAVDMAGLPAPLQRKLRGRPPKTVTKVAVKLRLDPDVLAALRATGAGA